MLSNILSGATRQKDYEEFYTEKETLDMKRFISIGIIKNEAEYDESKLKYFEGAISTR
jgi:hypothetical protein